MDSDNDQEKTEDQQTGEADDFTTEVPAVDINAPLRVDEAPVGEGIPPEKSGRKIFFLGSLAVGAVILIIGGAILFYLKNSSSKTQSSDEFESTPTGTLTPTPVFNRADWTLEILNGSGVAGEARKASEKLTALGYTVVKVGNATSQDYQESEFWVAKDWQDKAEQILEDLKTELKIASVSGELKDSTASARIILGKNNVE